jgi:RNA polymerase sigma-70 factor (ECF subfamily)
MNTAVTQKAPERRLDPEALGDHIDRLFRAAWALCGSREDAEDLVQETYARVLARPRLLRSDDDLGYLLRVLRNTFISARRTAARRPLRADADPETLDLQDPHGAAEPPAAAEAREVFAAVAALPADFRDVLVAVDVAGLSYDEAAKALHVRGGTIGSRLFRARSQIAESLDERTKPRSPAADSRDELTAGDLISGNRSRPQASFDGLELVATHRKGQPRNPDPATERSIRCGDSRPDGNHL